MTPYRRPTSPAKRIKELDAKKTSEEADALTQIVAFFIAGDTDAIMALLKQNPTLGAYELQNKKGAFIKSKITAALKDAQANAVLPEIYADVSVQERKGNYKVNNPVNPNKTSAILAEALFL